MKFNILLVETIVLVVIFNLAIFIPLCKNPVWWIHDYPKDIQDEYFKTHERIDAEPLGKIAVVKKSLFLIVGTLILALLMVLAGAKTFFMGFLGSYIIWFAINAWDCFFMDWILFANIKKIRLPGTEHMDKAYHQKKYHFIHGMIGVVLGLVPCVVVGLIIYFIN